MSLRDLYLGPNAVKEAEKKAGETSHESSSHHQAEAPSSDALRHSSVQAEISGEG